MTMTFEGIWADLRNRLNAFRRLVWMGAGPPNEDLAPSETVITKDVRAFQDIFAKLLTMQLGWV